MAFSLLRFDLRHPDFSPVSSSELYSAALEMAAWADERGFDGLVVSEHHGTDDGFLPSPIALMGALIGRTKRLRVSASALLLPLYDPIKLAEDLCILDITSGGRANLTVGIGYREVEYEMFGKDWASRGKRMDECLDVILRAWSGEPFEWNGRRVRLTPKPLTQPRPPIFVGGTAKVAARRAARFGLPFQPANNDPAVLGLYTSECQRLGVENPMLLPPGSGESIWVAEDPDRSWAEVGRYLLHEAMTYAGWQPKGQRTAVRSMATSVEELRAENKYRILTPEECLKRAEERGRFCDFSMHPLCGGTPPEFGWRSLELYASQVLPQLEG